MRFSAVLLGHAQTLLAEISLFRLPAETVLAQYFQRHPVLGRQDRKLLTEIMYRILRHYAPWREASGNQHRTMIFWGAQKSCETAAIAGFSTEESRQFIECLSQYHPSSAAIAAHLPDWLYKTLVAHNGQAHTQALARALCQPAPLDVRVNSLKTTREKALAALVDAGIFATKTPYAPRGLRFAQKTVLKNLACFQAGWLEPQDEGSQLIAEIVDPKRHEYIADFCAGAGGKTLALAAMMGNTGQIYAFDKAQKRLSALASRLARSGAKTVHPVAIFDENDAKLSRFWGKMQRVLVDAPCSGLGILRRQPDAAWRQTPESVADFASQQARILSCAARLLRPGGRLVYASCSFLPQENEAIVADFLARHPEFSLLSIRDLLEKKKIHGLHQTGPYLQLFTHLHHTDSFFIAALTRIAA